MISKKLCEISQVIMGQSPKGDSYNTDGVGMPLLNGAADYKGLSFNPKQYTDSPTRIAKKGDIILGIRATIGNFSITDKDYCIGRGVAAIRPNAKIVDKTYLLKRVESDLGKIIQKAAGSTIKGIKKEDLTDLLIPLPPLPEQKRIAEILDKADALRLKNKQLMYAYDELLQASFLDMFGDPVANPKEWKRKSLKDLVDKSIKYSLSSGPFGSSLTSVDYVDDGVPILRGVNVSSGYLDMTNVKFISEVKAKELVRSEIHPGDLVIIAVGSSGKALMIPNSLKRAIMSQNFNKITVNQKIVLPIFLEFSLNDRDIQQQIKRKMSDTVRTFFSLTNMKELQVICPPISLQNQFAQIVENIEAQKTLVRQSLQESEHLFNGLVQKAFSGEL